MSKIQHADKTMTELLALQREIEADPESKNKKPGSIFIYTPQARKRLDVIALRITEKMAEKRTAEGMPVPTAGYTGRMTNRAR